MKISTCIFAKYFLAILLAAALTGCAAGPFSANSLPPQATMVADAVSTIDARLTALAMADPAPTATQVPVVVSTQAAPNTTPLLPTLAATSAGTPTATPPAEAAQVLKVWLYPSTKTEYHGNEGFGIAIYLKNIGSTTWVPGFQLRLASHNGPAEITVQTFEDLTVDVPPQGKVEFDLWGFGSETAGKQVYTYKVFPSDGYAVAGSEATINFTSVP